MKISRDSPEFQIALNAPICPQLLRDDAIITNENGWYRTVTPSSPWAADNEILISNLNEQDADAEIELMIDEYHKRGLAFRWCVYPWTQPADLGESLIKRGATHWDVKVFLSDTSLPLDVVDGVEVEQVDPDSTESFEKYIRLMSSGWNFPVEETEFRRQHYRKFISGPDATLQLFVAYCDGMAAGCCATILKEDYGYMTGAYVDPAFQGRGLFQSLLATQHRALREKGISISCGHAYAHGSGLWLERFGFTNVYTYRIYKLDPPTSVDGLSIKD